MKSNYAYVSNFLGHVTLDEKGNNFIADVRKVLTGTGFYLLRRGGNPDRKQFAKDHWDHQGLRQSLPVKFATYVRLYLRVSEGVTPSVSLDHAKGRVAAVNKIYELSAVTA